MKISVTKTFSFEMAHQLDNCYSDECKNIHGHSYRLAVTFEGDLNKDGMVMDFKRIKEYVQPMVDFFDHNFLTSETLRFNPTAENMAIYIFQELKKQTRLIKKVKLWETASCYAEVGY